MKQRETEAGMPDRLSTNRVTRRRLLLGGSAILGAGASALGQRQLTSIASVSAREDFSEPRMRRRAIAQLVAGGQTQAVSQVEGSASAALSALESHLPPGATRFGAWVPGTPAELGPLNSIEHSIGARLGIVMWYQGWGAANAAFDVGLLDRAASRGAIPMVTWEPWDYTMGVDQPKFRLNRIASGHFDTYIRSWAEGLKAWGRPTLLRFGHEMNHTKYPWGVTVNGNSPADFLAAWRHIRSIFVDIGASNVALHWCPNADWEGSGQISFSDLFPGDDSVDVVGVDGYNGGTELQWGGWLPFSAVFGYSISVLRGLTSKPVVIGEVGSAEAGGEKVGWVGDMLTKDLPTTFSDVRGIVWFNEDREADWRMQSTAATLEAFRAGLQLPRYGAVTYGP